MAADARRMSVPVPGPYGRDAGRLVTVGGMLFTSSITGIDPQTGVLGPSPQTQIRLAFANLRSLLGAAGADSADIGLVTAALAEGGELQALQDAWLDLFPDADAAPMLKINTYPLPDGQHVQIQATGADRGGRQIVGAPGFSGPAPRGARVGDVFFSSVIDGRDPETGRPSGGPKAEMRQAFLNLKALIEAAGGSKDDLIHVLIFIRGREDQADMLAAWLKAFPEDGDRPARKAIFDPTLATEGKAILLLCVAALSRGRRENLEVPGIRKRHPNPMGCRIGNLVYSSGVGGDDPSGAASGQDPEMRAALAFQNMRSLLEVAGGSLEDIGMVSFTVNDYADETAIIRQWDRAFPDPDDAPARHVMAFGGRGSYPVQLHVVAALPRD